MIEEFYKCEKGIEYINLTEMPVESKITCREIMEELLCIKLELTSDLVLQKL